MGEMIEAGTESKRKWNQVIVQSHHYLPSHRKLKCKILALWCFKSCFTDGGAAEDGVWIPDPSGVQVTPKFSTLSSPYTDCISIFTLIMLYMITFENIFPPFGQFFFFWLIYRY